MLLLLLFFVSSVASVNISLTSGELCQGAVATWTCVADGSLGWRNLGETGFPSAVSSVLVSLGPASPFSSRAICITGTILTSIATANLTSAVNGSTLECTNSGFTSSSTTNVTLLLKESASISYLIAQFISTNEIVLHWGGAQCVSYYIIEVNGDNVTTTTDTSYSYMLPNNGGTIIFTVHGVNYTGNVFTTISKTLTGPGPFCSASHFLVHADGMYILHIMIKRDNADQLPIRHCNLTFNSTTYDCSDNRTIIFPVTPDEYNYRVVMSNAVDSTVCANDTVTVNPHPTSSSSTTTNSSPSTAATGSVIVTENTESPSPTVTPTSCPPVECELCPWALIVIILLAVLSISTLLILAVFIIWKFCFSQDKNNKRVNTTNKRTESPNEKEMAAL